MMGIIETQQARGLTDVMAVHEQALRLIDDVVVDVADGRAASSLADEVAKIPRRIGELRGTIGDGGEAAGQLTVLAEILLQQVVETLQQVAAALVLLRELPQVDAVAVFEYEAQIAEEDAPQRGRVVVAGQLLAHLGNELGDAEPLVGLHPQRAVEEIGEELIVVDLSLQLRSMQQLWRPQQHPSAERDALAVVLQSAYLSRLDGNDRGIARLQGLHAVGECLGKLALDEEPIDAVVVEAMAEGRQLVEVDDAQQRMEHGGINKPCVVVGVVYFQDLLHRGGKERE